MNSDDHIIIFTGLIYHGAFQLQIKARIGPSLLGSWADTVLHLLLLNSSI